MRRALSSGREEDFRAGDGLPAAGVVLAGPDLVVAELVEPGRPARGLAAGRGWGFSLCGGKGPRSNAEVDAGLLMGGLAPRMDQGVVSETRTQSRTG